MNADQLKGKWMQFKGELQQQWGKFTDDDWRTRGMRSRRRNPWGGKIAPLKRMQFTKDI